MGRGVVLAKSAALCFRLTAKMRSAPLLVLSPRDPLRWARAGAPILHVVWRAIRGPRESAQRFSGERRGKGAKRDLAVRPG